LGYALKHHVRAEQVSARNVAPGAIEDSIARHESDFGFTYLPVPTKGIAFVPVTRIAVGAFVRRGAFRNVPWGEIPCSIPFLRVEGAGPRGVMVDAWPDRIGRPRTLFQFDLLETALESVRQGLTWGCFPKFIAWLHNAQVKPQFELEALAVPRLARPAAVRAFLVMRAGDDETPEGDVYRAPISMQDGCGPLRCRRRPWVTR
jgi:DNA-binding transcriptional LysR family regulator